MDINYDVLKEFENITSKDIGAFFQRSLSFFNGDYNIIVSYYSGNTSTIDSEPFNNFTLLKQERDAVFEILNANIRKLNNLKWFILIEKIEDIDSRLRTLDNINKWSRSSLTKVGYDPSYQFDYNLKQKQTLERVAQDVLASSNPEDDWMDIALSNAIREEDYSPAGGTLMKLKLDKTNFNFKIDSVVDIIQDKSVYGKDLDKAFGFDSVENDLKVLGYDDTVLQAIDILANLKKNDITSARSLGLQSALIVGQNRALLNFPVIIRQMTSTFASDDSLKNFNISTLNYDQDNLVMEFDVKTRLNEVIPYQTNL